jgi:hypothetical protein
MPKQCIHSKSWRYSQYRVVNAQTAQPGSNLAPNLLRLAGSFHEHLHTDGAGIPNGGGTERRLARFGITRDQTCSKHKLSRTKLHVLPCLTPVY